MICNKCHSKEFMRDMKDGFLWCSSCDLMKSKDFVDDYMHYYLYEYQLGEKNSYALFGTVNSKERAEEWVGANPYRFWRDMNKEKYKTNNG